MKTNLTLKHHYVQIQPSERCITVIVYEPECSWTEQLKLLPHQCKKLSACQSTVERIMTPFNAKVYHRQSTVVVITEE